MTPEALLERRREGSPLALRWLRTTLETTRRSRKTLLVPHHSK